MTNHDPEAFEAARAVGIRGFGFYRRSGFIGPARSWGERFSEELALTKRWRAFSA